jgi:hypothetical protein
MTIVTMCADFETALAVFIPSGVAGPKSAQTLCLAFGVCFRDCWIPARRTQYCVPVVLELCEGIDLPSADVFNIAWVFRSWLDDYSGMHIPEAYLPRTKPEMSTTAVTAHSEAMTMVEILKKHMRECARCLLPHIMINVR